MEAEKNSNSLNIYPGYNNIIALAAVQASPGGDHLSYHFVLRTKAI